MGRAAAHRALREIGRDDSPILTGPHRQPVWPVGIAGSISHSARLGVALVAPSEHTDGVGIDIEERTPAPELHKQVPRPEERSWLEEKPPHERDDLVLALFSAKETIFKAFYPRVGSFFGFEAASLVPAPQGFQAKLVEDLDPNYPQDRTFQVQCVWSGDLVLTSLILPSGDKAPPDSVR